MELPPTDSTPSESGSAAADADDRGRGRGDHRGRRPQRHDTVTTPASFLDIDALHLYAETVSDATVSIIPGDQRAVIRGQDSYDHGDGDLGVPALGTGSHASAIGQMVEFTHDDSVERPSGKAIADDINTTEFSVDFEYSNNSARTN